MENKVEVKKLLARVGVTRLLALSFLSLIIIGTILLMLPISNKVTPLSFIDNLFVATSATCVTGLVPIVVSQQYNVFGQWVLIFLMQFGGLGIMTFLMVIMTLMKHKLNFTEKKIVQDSLNKRDFIDIPKYIITIVKYTAFFEFIGFIILCCRFIPDFGLTSGMFKSLFTSISAFCNAGIDNLGGISLMGYVNDPVVNFTIMFLIIMGGLGFAVWFDLKDSFKQKCKNKTSFKRMAQHLQVHTKLVLFMTCLLLVSGTIVFFLVEFNNPLTLKEYNIFEKIMISMFQSTTLRTAGFSTINIGNCNVATQFIMLFYMLIGGSPGGTAGGIKTTTFAMLFFFVLMILKNDQHINVFKRDISRITFMRSFVILLFYCTSLIIGIFILSITENLPFLSITYEAFSAIATVGLSMGITPALSVGGKIVIIVLMFIGRVGPLTIFMSLFSIKQSKKSKEYAYPHGDILIG